MHFFLLGFSQPSVCSTYLSPSSLPSTQPSRALLPPPYSLTLHLNHYVNSTIIRLFGLSPSTLPPAQPSRALLPPPYSLTLHLNHYVNSTIIRLFGLSPSTLPPAQLFLPLHNNVLLRKRLSFPAGLHSFVFLQWGQDRRGHHR